MWEALFSYIDRIVDKLIDIKILLQGNNDRLDTLIKLQKEAKK